MLYYYNSITCCLVSMLPTCLFDRCLSQRMSKLFLLFSSSIMTNWIETELVADKIMEFFFVGIQRLLSFTIIFLILYINLFIPSWIFHKLGPVRPPKKEVVFPIACSKKLREVGREKKNLSLYFYSIFLQKAMFYRYFTWFNGKIC